MHRKKTKEVVEEEEENDIGTERERERKEMSTIAIVWKEINVE